MAKVSAGLLLYRRRHDRIEVLLVHPGGPFWKGKDAGAWTIPQGEPAEGEDLLATAKREFAEELGVQPNGEFHPLSPVQQKGGKTVHAWAVEGDLDATQIKSNTFTIEWPPRSGKQAAFPEIDRAEFYDIPTAMTKINAAQIPLLTELQAILK